MKMNFSDLGNGTIVVIKIDPSNGTYSLQCLAIDRDYLPKTIPTGSTCWIADTQEVTTLHQGEWV